MVVAEGAGWGRRKPAREEMVVVGCRGPMSHGWVAGWLGVMLCSAAVYVVLSPLLASGQWQLEPEEGMRTAKVLSPSGSSLPQLTKHSLIWHPPIPLLPLPPLPFFRFGHLCGSAGFSPRHDH